MNYNHITKDQVTAKITLDKEQQALILAIHDHGARALNPDNVHLLYGIIADLKNSIHK